MSFTVLLRENFRKKNQLEFQQIILSFYFSSQSTMNKKYKKIKLYKTETWVIFAVHLMDLVLLPSVNNITREVCIPSSGVEMYKNYLQPET